MEEILRLKQSPKKWTKWPVLPLKRDTEHGFLGAVGGHLTTVFLGNPPNVKRQLRGALRRFPNIKYETFEEIIKDGWILE